MTDKELELEKAKALALSAQLPDEVDEEKMKADAQASVDAKHEENLGTIKAVGLGAMEAVPFSKDVAAAGEAVYDSIQQEDELSLGGMTEEYRRNKREWDDAINKAEEDNPVAFHGADFATTVGMGILTGGTATMARSATFGAVEGLSRSEDRTMLDAATGAALGGVGHKVGKYIGEAMQFVGEKLGILSSKGGVEAVGATSKTAVKRLDNHISRMYIQNGTNKNMKSAYMKFTKELLEETDVNGGKFLNTLQTVRETSEKAVAKRDFYGQEISRVLKSVDEKVPKINVQSLHDDLVEELVEPLSKISDPNAKQIAVKLSRRLKAQFMVKDGTKKIEKLVPGPNNVLNKITEEVDTFAYRDLKLNDIHKLKNYVAKEVRNSFDKDGRALSSEALELKKYVGKAGEYIDDVIESSGVEIPEAATYKLLKRKWANMNIISEVASDAAASNTNGPMSLLKTTLSLKGPILLAASGAGASMHPALGPVVAIGINQSLASSRTPVMMAKGLAKVADFLTKNPNHKYAKSIMTAASLSTEALHNEVSGIIGSINLMGSPVQRSSDSVKQKRSSILAAVARQDKELANQLQEALDNDADVGAIMDQISKLPETQKFIEPGIGWDGMVYDPADKAQLEEEVRNANLPITQEIALLEELKQNKIPNIQPMEPFVRPWSPRDRSKQGY